MVLKLLYTFLIGIFFAVFVGVGIAAFYPQPKFPEQPTLLKYSPPEITKDTSESAKYKVEAEKFDRAQRKFQEQLQLYNRNVSIIALVASIIIVIASLTLVRTILLIADGLLLGGVLTLIYSVIRGFGTDDNMFRFIVVSVGLLVSLFLGYVKFIKSEKK
jgi:uncharacterized membrane protein